MKVMRTTLFPRAMRRKLLRCCSTATAAADTATPTTQTTHFGFKEVPVEQKEEMVGNVFHSVADNYDIMNDVMSAGLHRAWKNYFVSKLDPQLGCNFLDVAGGTGDIAFRIVDALQSKANSSMNIVPGTTVTVCDINTSMLQVGQDRAKVRYDEATSSATSLSWLHGNAEELDGIASNSIDVYTIAFGIRNVTNIPKALREAYRVLKPGGRFMCLEFSKVPPALKPFYETYTMQILPVMGHLIASDWDSYQYLAESIEKFPKQEKFAEMIAEAGFSNVGFTNLTTGIVAIHEGFKWKEEGEAV